MIDWGVKEGARLKELRLKKGYSQGYVAQKIQCGVSSMNRWEAGACAPRAHFMKDLAFLYNVTIEDIIGGTGAVVVNPLPYIEYPDFKKAVDRAVELITPAESLSQKTKDLLEMMAKLTGKTTDEMLDTAVREYAQYVFDWNKALEEFCDGI